jgi:hypothetical protein
MLNTCNVSVCDIFHICWPCRLEVLLLVVIPPQSLSESAAPTVDFSFLRKRIWTALLFPASLPLWRKNGNVITVSPSWGGFHMFSPWNIMIFCGQTCSLCCLRERAATDAVRRFHGGQLNDAFWDSLCRLCKLLDYGAEWERQMLSFWKVVLGVLLILFIPRPVLAHMFKIGIKHD